MKNVTSEEACNCPLECDAINYSYYFVSSPFDPAKMCPRNKDKEKLQKIGSPDFLMKEFYLSPMPPQGRVNKNWK